MKYIGNQIQVIMVDSLLNFSTKIYLDEYQGRKVKLGKII